MRIIPHEGLLFTSDTTHRFAPLADLEQCDRMVISCYFDTRAGISRCLTFLNTKSAPVRASLHGTERFEFDVAVEVIRRALVDVATKNHPGIAVFSCGTLNDQQLTLLPLASAPDNRLVYSRAPEILPLVALQQSHPAGMVLWATAGRLELLQTGLDATQAPLWQGALPESWRCVDSNSEGRTRLTRWQTGRRPHGLRQDLRNALSACQAPLLLAADGDTLVPLADWLPEEATERLLGCTRPTPDATRESVLKTARRELNTIYHSTAKEFARVLVRRHDGVHTAMGFRPVHNALKSDAADVVVMSDWDRFGHGLPWESKVAICFEALRRKCRIILCDSLELRRAGGIVCLLRAGRETVDGQATAHPDRLRRVA